MSHRKRESFGDDLYSGAASFGRIMAIVGAVIMTIVGIIMLGFGIKILTTKSTKVETIAQVISANCTQWVDREGNKDNTSSTLKYNCDVHFKYLVGSEETLGDLTINSTTHYREGQKFDVYYEKGNPADVSTSGPIPHNVGWILIVLGIILPLIAWVWVWITRKYKFAAAMQGADSGIGILGGRGLF